MPYETLAPEQAATALQSADILVAPEQVRIVRRDDRWLVSWQDNKLAWFAATPEAQQRMQKERIILGLLSEYCTFQTPSMYYTDPQLDFDVRWRVRGSFDPVLAHDRLQARPDLAKTWGNWLGKALVELHSVPLDEAALSALPRKASWPESRSWIEERLPRVTDDKLLIEHILILIDRVEALDAYGQDQVLAHTDIGLHNVVFDPASLQPIGLIDFEAAAWVDRHYDFRYMILDYRTSFLLDAAMETYQAVSGIHLNRDRIYLFNAASACSFLANRADVDPDTLYYGRTLQEDLFWTRSALARCGIGL